MSEQPTLPFDEDTPIKDEPKGKYQNVVQDDFDEPEGTAV